MRIARPSELPRKRPGLRALLPSLVIGLFAACASPTILPVKEPNKACEIQTVHLSVVASPTINPTPDGEPRPVLLRVYQLKDDIRMQNASFDEVWKQDATTLGEDLVTRDELYAYPETRTEVKFERNPDARHVVAAGMFRGWQGKSWFVAFELPPAPGKGDCPADECTGEGCKPDLNPRFALWVDNTRVEEGSNHLEDVSDDRRVRSVNLGKSGAAAPSAAAPATSKP